MTLKDDEFGFSRDINGNVEGIIISKKALEKWRKHYRTFGCAYKTNLLACSNMGKADILDDILELFKTEK